MLREVPEEVLAALVVLPLVLEPPYVFREPPYEPPEEEELPPRCCDWPNSDWREIARATLSRHVPAIVCLRIVESSTYLSCVARTGVVPD